MPSMNCVFVSALGKLIRCLLRVRFALVADEKDLKLSGIRLASARPVRGTAVRHGHGEGEGRRGHILFERVGLMLG